MAAKGIVNLGTIAYIPPPGVCNSEAFYANISKVKAHYPLYLFSDSKQWNPSQLIKWPEFTGKRPPWAINNFLWFKALEIALAAKLDYFLYVESDSRVAGDGFDQWIFNDFFHRYPNGIACAGTPVCWDVAAGGREFGKRIISEAWNYQQATGIPMSFYSKSNPMDCTGAAYYPNGSLAIYDTLAMNTVFAGFNVDIVMYSRFLTAFDLAIGRALWTYHRDNVTQHVGWLSSCYSAYGNCITTEKERLGFLRDRKFAAIHQCKGDVVL